VNARSVEAKMLNRLFLNARRSPLCYDLPQIILPFDQRATSD
jgi:hypothetical protein